MNFPSSMVSRLKESLLQNRGTRQKIAKNVFWLTAGQIGSRLFRAIIVIYAARVLGAGEYGVFAYVLGLAGFFTIFADIGVNPILTRDAAKNPRMASYYFAAAFWIKITLIFFTAGLVIFLAPHFSSIEAAKGLLPLVALLTAFDGIRELSIAFLRSKEKMELEALITTFTNIAVVVFGFVILYFVASAQALAVIYTISAGAGTIVGIAVLRKQFGGVVRFFRKSFARVIIASAWPIALLGIMGVFMFQTDIVMLGFFRTSEEIGLYSAGQKIVQIFYVLPSILAISIFPVLSRFIGQQDNVKIKTLMERGITAVISMALPIVVGGIILGKSIIGFLYGSGYLAGTLTFQILILTPLLVFPGMLIGNYIMAYDKQKKMAPYFASGAIGNIVLNIVLIPLFGIVGAAIATVSTQILYNSLIWRLAKKINNFYILRHLKKIVIATIIMGIGSFVFNKIGLHILFNIAASGTIYIGLLLLFKETMVKEIKMMVSSIRK